MKIVDAYWERRNLGVDVKEIVCDELDTVEELKEILRHVEAPYSVVKIPSGCVPLLLAAQQCGYFLIEASISYEGSMKTLCVPRVYGHFAPHVSISEASGELVRKALDEMESGRIFTTDRIALDPMFSREMAGKRYANWCRDEMEAGAEMEIAYYKGEPFAFNISREEKDRPGAFLGLMGGMFSTFLNKGMGFLLVHCEIEACRKNGGKWYLGTTSSNNMPSLRLHLRYGFEITRTQYVLIKHQ